MSNPTRRLEPGRNLRTNAHGMVGAHLHAQALVIEVSNAGGQVVAEPGVLHDASRGQAPIGVFDQQLRHEVHALIAHPRPPGNVVVHRKRPGQHLLIRVCMLTACEDIMHAARSCACQTQCAGYRQRVFWSESGNFV